VATRAPADRAAPPSAPAGEPTLADTAIPASATATPLDGTQEVLPPPLSTPLPTTTVVEGPVETISGRVITVFGIDIEVAAENPLLSVLQIGDVVRVEGEASERGSTMVIIAAKIVLVDAEIFVNDAGLVWRDDGGCFNPPPPWASAAAWRARCARQESPGGKPRSGGSSR